MAGHRGRSTLAAAVLSAAVLTGCSGNGGDSGPPPDPAESAASRAASAASSLASRGADAVASATAEAGRWLADIRQGGDARSETRTGTPGTDGEGRATVPVTVRNTAASEKSFAVQVDFTAADGGRPLDTVVVLVHDVPAGKNGRATARSTRPLSGSVRADVARAVRY
ncbi:hypothetical protein [Streptomyces sp. SID8352]|uniref:hypothetical protein n=1 Tax=Streptomyces sp. SID8352 TaxID=2690338 RepID=UPI00136802D5|nr:hypothetical protein [Streptomyces sp. SID8352]MYU22392.1 hypothetical protein [Streptomyces sp. SID8352]